MDERFEALCEIGDLVVGAGRYDLVETYYDLLCEHYPVDILTALAIAPIASSSESEDEEEGPPLEPEPEPEPELKEICQGPVEEDDKLEEAEIDSDYESDSSEGSADSEEYEIKCDENGFLSLA